MQQRLSRRRRRGRGQAKGKKKIVYYAQEEVSVDASKDVCQSARAQAAETTEALDAAPVVVTENIVSQKVDATKDVGQLARVQAPETTKALEATPVEVDMSRGEKQPVTNTAIQSALLLEKESVGRNYKIAPQRLVRPRYFEPPDGSWVIGGNSGEERHTIVNYKMQKQKRPCYICASFGHSWKCCKQRQDCFVWKGRGQSAKDSLDNRSSNICLRCGGSGHGMFSCRNVYSPDDLKKIQCYMCKSFGHLCCVDFRDMHPRQLSCYSCGQSGHQGSECAKFRRDNSGSKSAAVERTIILQEDAQMMLKSISTDTPV